MAMNITYDDRKYWSEPESESTTHYINYRVEKDGVPITPVVTSWLEREAEYHITYWTTTYSATYLIEHGFIFTKTTSFPLYDSDSKTTYSFLLSDQSVGSIDTSGELLNSKNGHVVKDVKPTKETCGPALQVELSDGTMRWLFPHPDGQRAAWEHLCNTTTEDDLIRIAEIGMNIIENHKSL